MKFVVSVVNITTEIELNGINTAAIKGDKIPSIAKVNPATLYKNEIIKRQSIVA